MSSRYNDCFDLDFGITHIHFGQIQLKIAFWGKKNHIIFLKCIPIFFYRPDKHFFHIFLRI